MPGFTARVVLAALALAVSATAALAQYPNKIVRIIAPAPPGGSTDAIARLVQPGLQELLKQTVIVEARGGAGGYIGSDYVAKSPPDGYTLLVGGAFATITASMRKQPAYNAEEGSRSGRGLRQRAERSGRRAARQGRERCRADRRRESQPRQTQHGFEWRRHDAASVGRAVPAADGGFAHAHSLQGLGRLRGGADARRHRHHVRQRLDGAAEHHRRQIPAARGDGVAAAPLAAGHADAGRARRQGCRGVVVVRDHGAGGHAASRHRYAERGIKDDLGSAGDPQADRAAGHGCDLPRPRRKRRNSGTTKSTSGRPWSRRQVLSRYSLVTL